MAVKEGVRIIALDDGPFTRSSETALVVGIVGRKGAIEGAISFRVEVDGSDATDKLAGALRKSRFFKQIKVAFLNGILLGGLNAVDICKINDSLHIPVIALTRKMPHMRMLKDAIAKSGKGAEKKFEMLDEIERKSGLKRVGKYYARYVGIGESDIKMLVGEGAELLRLAHIVASGVASGESKGRM